MPRALSKRRITDLMGRDGPCLSSCLAKLLERQGSTNAGARQAIRRVGDPLMRLANIRFPHNQAFLYLKEQFRTDPFWISLMSAFETSGSVYGHALFALKARGGIVPSSQFGVISGSPERLKGHLSYETVLERLLKLEILEESTIAGIGKCVSFGRRTPFSVIPHTSLRARQLAEEILLVGVADWIRKNSFGSWGKIKTRSVRNTPQFSHFEWDLTAPSYALPLTSRSESGTKPGFIAMDVTLSKFLDSSQVSYFRNKCNIIANQRRSRPFLPIIIGSSFTKEALRFGRSAGLIFTTPSNLLGGNIGEALRSLVEVLENAAAVAVSRPEVIDELFSKLGKIEGAANNLRGALFELLVGHCVREVEGSSIDIGKEVTAPDTGKRAEIDVLRVKGNQEVCAYECKGYGASKQVRAREVDKWLGTTIPRIYKWMKSEERFERCSIGFEFWTSGAFSPDAIALLRARANRTKRYTIRWKDGSAVYEYSRQLRERRIEAVLEQHFTAHPLSKLR